MQNETITISNGRQVVVYKLFLKKYVEVLGAIEELPKILDEVTNKDTSEIIANLPRLIHTCFPDVVKITAIVTDLSAQEIEEQLGLDDFVRIVEAFLKVNDFSYIQETIKKMTARQTGSPELPSQVVTEPQNSGSTE